MEYDLLTLGVDLADLYRGSLSLRRLRVIVNGLPAASRLNTVIRRELRQSGATPTPIEDLPPETWSETEWQLADLRDRIGRLLWMYACAHRAPNTPAPAEPAPVPRPGIRKPRPASRWLAAFGLSDVDPGR